MQRIKTVSSGRSALSTRLHEGPGTDGRTARPRLRCAVAGLGRIGSTLEDDPLREKPASHAGAIRANRDCVLVAGCDPRQDRREAFARRWRCPALYASLDEMLAAQRPDILHLATPTETHSELIATAASLHTPVIVSEKPLCQSAEAARAALAACRAGGSMLVVNHERRYSRDYLRARSLVLESRYGALLSLQARLYMGRGQRPAAILLEDGTHLIDAIRFLSGGEIEPRCVRGDPDSPTGTLQILFGCGPAAGFLEVSGGHEALVFELELAFQRGHLRIGNGVYEESRSAPSRFYRGFHSLRQIRTPRFHRTGYFAGMLADAMAVARYPGKTPVSSGRDGLRALETIESILAHRL